jgi:hypothetical protein
MKEDVWMTAAELGRQLINQLRESPDDVDRILEQLRSNTRKGGPIDPSNEQSSVDTWWAVGKALRDSGFYNQAIALTLGWYNAICERQVANNERYHKGTSTNNIGSCYMSCRELTCASWFYTLAFIEDVLTTGEKIPSLPAAKNLRITFNLSNTELETMADIALDFKSGCGEWIFPENIAVATARRHRRSLVPLPGLSEVPINRPFFQKLISKLHGGDNASKKQSLEFIASYLNLTLPNVHIIPNATTLEHEIDLLVTQHAATPTYLLEALGRSFLVECKNWTKPVDAEALNHFVAKMRFHRCRCGVLFSQRGLTGDYVQGRGLLYARLTQLRWYAQDDCIVIVITEDDLNKLASDAGGTFGSLLLREYESVRFSTSEKT